MYYGASGRYFICSGPKSLRRITRIADIGKLSKPILRDGVVLTCLGDHPRGSRRGALRAPAKIACQKRPRLLYQNIAHRRTIQAGAVDCVLERAELGRSVILLDHIDDQQPGRRVMGDRKPHGIRSADPRKAVAAAARVAAVAHFTLLGFRGLENLSSAGLAGSRPGIS